MQSNWRTAETDCGCAQRLRTPDFYGRATAPSIARPEITCDLSAALGIYANAESFLRSSQHTRLRGRCDDHNYAPPERWMQLLPYQWQQNDIRPWMDIHITRNDISDCRGVDLPIWKQTLVVKPPSGQTCRIFGR